jgi:predicted Zn-dependent peptidase
MAITYPNMNSTQLLKSARANFQQGRFERVTSAMRILRARANLTNLQLLQLNNLASRAKAYANRRI